MREYAVCSDVSARTADFDVVVVGAGVAGLYTALNVESGLSCAVLNKMGPEESNSMYAQGGIASVTLECDSTKKHYDDTLIAGAGLCNKKAVRILVTEGPENIERLIKLNIPFDRDKTNKLAVSKEGAHSQNRIIHCGGDATGFHLTKALYEVAEKRDNIHFFDNTVLCDVITDGSGEVCGVIAASSGGYLFLRSRFVVIAAGGIGRIYRNSTNASSATGDGIAAAVRAGAKTSNMEFVQFHPTALIHPDKNMRYFLISEALRGEGAVLCNRKSEAFLKNVHPLADLAPRDIVSRAIINEMRKNDVPNVYLDITSKPREFLKSRFPMIYAECMSRGIDIAVNWIPVVPVQHYFMGGIKTDEDGKTNIKGLYACGESACTGVHGANRLASNSLLECLVFARRCALSINGSYAKPFYGKISFGAKKENKDIDFETFRSQIRNIMTKKCGIIRCGKELHGAHSEMEAIYETLKGACLRTESEYQTLNMSLVAREILSAAYKRKKSAGSHYRSDDSEG